MVWVSLEMCYHVRDAKKHQVIVLLHPPPVDRKWPSGLVDNTGSDNAEKSRDRDRDFFS